MTTTAHRHVAAWVDHEPVDEAEVDAALARLRSGPRAALLPVAGSAEGRQLRRWVTQTVVTTRLLEREAARVGPLRATSLAEIAPDRMAALQLGGVVANVLAEFAAARAVFAHVTSGCNVSPDQAKAYHRRNPDQFADAHGVEHPLDAMKDMNAVDTVDAVAAAITSMLLAASRRRYFINWLGVRSAESIHLEPGYEHPGDPRQPDATHRH